MTTRFSDPWRPIKIIVAFGFVLLVDAGLAIGAYFLMAEIIIPWVKSLL